ncbi:NUMOD4 motif-containing HNH endonuclease [Spirosoma luteum]|uniref:NUMOD4 motif-containing HNH endonuclease n=1 Tax=Spirosoma luteum TaxID=431553 RepID=UPI000A0364FC|nr:NUMOD4 motif-containing HNH endonuclease [Spirosoma luteum]
MGTTNVEQTGEVWRDIPGYEGLYTVSNFGRITSCHDKYASRRKVKGDRILSPHIRGGLYRYVGLYKHKKAKTWSVHSLVMLAFVGERPTGYVINHIDGQKTNNHIENLEYCTVLENNRHAIVTGLKDPKRVKVQRNHTPRETILHIRNSYLMGETVAQISRQVKIAPTAVRKIAKRISYHWI